MNIESFEEALIAAYIKDPCRIQPTALWKTLQQVNSFNHDFLVENNEVTKLKLWKDEFLHTYWDIHSNAIDMKKEDFEKLKMAIIHETQMNELFRKEFPKKEAFFRIIYDNSLNYETAIPSGFEMRNVDVDSELRDVSELICRCYENIKPGIDEVRKWTKHPVFNRELWIWIIDKNNNRPAGLGIAEYDDNIKEGSLEWIQVLPEYKGKGIGKAIVIELVNRLKKYADFITVSGQVDNKTNPENLYRKCGFCGNDVWYVLKR